MTAAGNALTATDRLRTVTAWAVIVLIAGPVGTAVVLGVVFGESPCILCWAQRTSMMLIALVGLFVLRYGPRPRYLGLAVLLGAWGVFMALRHSALHLARDIGQGFAAPIFGVHTYAWAGFVHFVVLIVVGMLLVAVREGLPEWSTQATGRASRLAFPLFVVVIAANAFQAFVTTGPPPFIGQADPVRFSLNPRHWVWMMEELHGRVSLRGSWTVPRPDPGMTAADPEPGNGPLADLPSLTVIRWDTVGAPVEGQLTDLALRPPSLEERGGQGVRTDGGDGQGMRTSETDGPGMMGEGEMQYLAVTDHHGVYLLDGTLSRVLHHVVLDHQFSIDLTPLAGAAFIGDTLAVVATNKSYVLLRPDPQADADRMWPRFVETDGGITELRRSRFQTVRARQMYVLSLAFDAEAEELITISVPSRRHPRLVVSRFTVADLLLASEFEPGLGPGLALTDADRSPGEFVVTGATVVDGFLYAISTQYSTLLVIDLRDRNIRAGYAVPGLEHPVGLTARGPQLLVAQADGRVAVIERPALEQQP